MLKSIDGILNILILIYLEKTEQEMFLSVIDEVEKGYPLAFRTKKVYGFLTSSEVLCMANYKEKGRHLGRGECGFTVDLKKFNDFLKTHGQCLAFAPGGANIKVPNPLTIIDGRSPSGLRYEPEEVKEGTGWLAKLKFRLELWHNSRVITKRFLDYSQEGEAVELKVIDNSEKIAVTSHNYYQYFLETGYPFCRLSFVNGTLVNIQTVADRLSKRKFAFVPSDGSVKIGSINGAC